jgi:hypothetical protein
VDLWVGIKEGILASQNIAKSKLDLKKMQVIHFDQDMQVCEIFIIFLMLKYFFVLL